MTKQDTPHLTIVGGQPQKQDRKTELEVPVGLEKLLFLAAGDKALRADLLEDRIGTVERLGFRLRKSEAAMLETISNAQLKAMIDCIQPENSKRRQLMRVVAAAATSVAAGTAVISCDSFYKTKGADGDAGVESGAADEPDAGADGGN